MTIDSDSPATHPHGETPSAASAPHKARAGDRGATSGRNIAQNRAVGQDDPSQGSRSGRERDKAAGFPGDGEANADPGTNAAQTKDAEQGDSAP